MVALCHLDKIGYVGSEDYGGRKESATNTKTTEINVKSPDKIIEIYLYNNEIK